MLNGKDLVSIRDLSAEIIEDILKTAESFMILNKGRHGVQYLQGKTVVLIFRENQMRKKLSFEMAAKYLGANVLTLSTDNLMKTGSDVAITGKLLDQIGADYIILTHSSSGATRYLAKNVKASVINEGDGLNESPIRALVDLAVIKSFKKSFSGLVVVFLGDMLHSRVGMSTLWALLKLGVKIRIASPPTLVPKDIGENSPNVEIFYDPYKAVEGVDVILVQKTLDDEMYKTLIPSFEEYKSLYKLNNEMLFLAKKDVIVLHTGVIRRGIEIDTKIMEDSRVKINDHLLNGTSIRMAVLYLLSLGEGLYSNE